MTKSQNGSDDHEVGRGKPPKHTRFKKGQSGNPMGRRKGAKNIATIVREEAAAKVNVVEGGKSKKTSKAEAATKALMAMALKGDSRSLTLMFSLLERHYSDAAAEKEMSQPFTEVELAVIRSRAALLKLIEDATHDDDEG